MSTGKLNLARQRGYIPKERLNTKIFVAGAGMTGSWTILALAKMGLVNIEVADFDLVAADGVNIPAQVYGPQDMSRPKVKSLAKIVKRLTGTDIKCKVARFDGAVEDGNVLVVAVDSLVARQEIFEMVKERDIVLIDIRVGAEMLRLVAVSLPNEADHYKETLFSPSGPYEAPCGFESIIHVSLIAAGLVVRQVQKYLNYEEIQRDIYFDLKHLFLGDLNS